jgi:small subunit ribosomal protein S20
MPIIESAKKAARQALVRRARNQPFISQMKSLNKQMNDLIAAGELAKAKKLYPQAISAIDTAAKKNLIHKNNAARKKSRIEKALSALAKKK